MYIHSKFPLLVYLSLCVLSIQCANTHHRQLQQIQRSQLVGRLCSQVSNISSLINLDYKAQAQQDQASIQANFKTPGSDVVNALIQNKSNIGQAIINQMSDLGAYIGVYIGFFAVGLLVLIVMWPFLCCCCCCPKQCPSKCCQKSDEQQYKTSQLIFPLAVLTIALLTSIIASGMGIQRASELQQNILDFQCAVALVLDNGIYGNESSKGEYFIGFDKLIQNLISVKDITDDIRNQINRIKYTNGSGILRTTYDEGINLLNAISSIPDGNINGSMPSFTYDHFDGTSANINSLLPSIIGTTLSQDPSGSIYEAHSSLHTLNEALKAISDDAQTFSSQNSFYIHAHIDYIAASMNRTYKDIKDSYDFVSDFTTSTQFIINNITITLKAFFGSVIGVGSLCIFASFLMICCKFYSCRYFIYLLCTILVFMCLFAFVMSIGLSSATLTLTFGCDFINNTLSSTTNYTKNLSPLIGSQFLNNLKACLATESGDIISQPQGTDSTFIKALSSTLSQVRAFNLNLTLDSLNTNLNKQSSIIDAYYYTDRFDFNSDYDTTILRNLSNPSLYNCVTNSFQQDSWVPSLRQNIIKCYNTSRNASSTQCPDSTAIQGGHDNSIACYGCIDSTKILLNSADISADLNSRYGSSGECGSWVTSMGNLWTNYYLVKKNKLNPLRTRMSNVLNSYTTSNTGYQDLLTNVGSQFTLVLTNLQSLSGNIFNSPYGLVNGLNCLLISENVNALSDFICINLFSSFYYFYIIFGISSFGILFAICCSTCQNVQIYKHIQRNKAQIVPIQYFNQQIIGADSTMIELNSKTERKDQKSDWKKPKKSK